MRMNCWKAINLNKQYGHLRMTIFSLMLTLFTFIIIYIPAAYFFSDTMFNNNVFIIFFTMFILLYPLHKFFHFLSLLPYNDKIKKSIYLKSGFYPIIMIQINEPISKWACLLALSTPSIVINSSLILLSFIFTEYAVYLIILLSYHIGLSFSDMVYIKYVMSAPKNSYIEENETGIEILVLSTD